MIFEEQEEMKDPRASAKASRRVLELYKMFGAQEEEKVVDFFFYADEADHALDLLHCLKDLHYHAECVPPGDARDKWLITGQTQKLHMEEGALVVWTETMEAIAQRCHARFDGWGTPVND